MRQLLRQAALLGYITAVVKDSYYRTELMHQFDDFSRAMDATQGSTSAADFRDRLGVGRKLATKFWSFLIAAASLAAVETIIYCEIAR